GATARSLRSLPERDRFAALDVELPSPVGPWRGAGRSRGDDADAALALRPRDGDGEIGLAHAVVDTDVAREEEARLDRFAERLDGGGIGLDGGDGFAIGFGILDQLGDAPEHETKARDGGGDHAEAPAPDASDNFPRRRLASLLL